MIRVGVTGLHLGENCQPGPGVARSLRAALGDDVHIIGLAYDVFDSSLYADDLLDDAFMLPYPSAGPAAYLARLLEIHAIAGLDVLVPCLDVELPVVLRLADQLAAHGIATLLPSADALARRTKDQLPILAKQIDVAVPETITIGDHAALAAAGKRLGFPLVVKGPFYEAEIAHGPAEAAAAMDRLSARWGLPVLAQKFIAGEEFDVVALGDGRACVGAVAMRKTIVTKLGKAWGAVTIHDDDLLAVARRAIEALAWRGGCEIEMLRARAGGKLYLIEINPRFPAWVYLATAAGVNLPLGALQLARGDDVTGLARDYQAGMFYVRHAAETIGTLGDMEALMTAGRRRAPRIAKVPKVDDRG